jgi:hypothetical protein
MQSGKGIHGTSSVTVLFFQQLSNSTVYFTIHSTVFHFTVMQLANTLLIIALFITAEDSTFSENNFIHSFLQCEK